MRTSHYSAKMLRLPPRILARKVVVRVILSTGHSLLVVLCKNQFSDFFIFSTPQKCFKNFRGFVRTPRTPPPYGPALTRRYQRDGALLQRFFARVTIRTWPVPQTAQGKLLGYDLRTKIVLDPLYIIFNSDSIACPNRKYQRFIDKTGNRSLKANNFDLQKIHL